MKLLNLFALVFFSAPLFSLANVNYSYSVSTARDSVTFKLSNSSEIDRVCEDVSIQINISQDVFNDLVSSQYHNLTWVYLPAHSTQTMPKLAETEILSLRESGATVMVHSAEISMGQCRVANFVDYCKRSDLSDEESYTLERIKDVAGYSDCSLVEEEIGDKLKLKQTGIKDVTPISYLRNLEHLDISNNPVADISPLVHLPKIEVIKANDTLVAHMPFTEENRQVRKIYLRNTPYDDNN